MKEYCLIQPFGPNGPDIVSQHRYRYAAGIGDAWSVKRVLPVSERYTYSADTIGGTVYNYGLDAPHYPVPAIAGPFSYPLLAGYGIECWLDGSMFVWD